MAITLKGFLEKIVTFVGGGELAATFLGLCLFLCSNPLSCPHWAAALVSGRQSTMNLLLAMPPSPFRKDFAWLRSLSPSYEVGPLIYKIVRMGGSWKCLAGISEQRLVNSFLSGKRRLNSRKAFRVSEIRHSYFICFPSPSPQVFGRCCCYFSRVPSNEGPLWHSFSLKGC